MYIRVFVYFCYCIFVFVQHIVWPDLLNLICAHLATGSWAGLLFAGDQMQILNQAQNHHRSDEIFAFCCRSDANFESGTKSQNHHREKFLFFAADLTQNHHGVKLAFRCTEVSIA